MARLTQQDWQREWDKMLNTCGKCHSADFAQEQLRLGDNMIRQSDHLMAEAIRTVAGLYRDGIPQKPANCAYPFPDMLTFHNAPTEIEQKLLAMMMEHRVRTFQGTFHSSPDYAMWYGWSEMERDLTEINTLAAEMRREHRTTSPLKLAAEIGKPPAQTVVLVVVIVIVAVAEWLWV